MVRARFAQLTYSSFDDGTGIGGGWQVKETSGELSDSESETLRYWVHTTFDLVTPLPQFPTPEDVDNFPRRLMYTTLDEGRAGYWHTAPAGADGSGRPGNVFAHTVMDRNIAATDLALRPIDLWRSKDWLTPYGAGDVASATLPESVIPQAAEVVSRGSVVEFLCESDTWRMGILSVLLDAVASALEGGPPIVLGTDSPDSAAMWIGAVSHLTSPSVSRTINWSTFDRASGVAAAAARGVHLIAVPQTDLLSMVANDGLVVLSENEVPAMGDLGGAPHRTENGSSVIVTEWSVIAQGVLIDADTARSALASMERVSTELGDAGLHPVLPLALTVAVTAELHDDVGDEAAAVIARHSPERLSTRADLVGPASDMIDRTLGSTAADCWRRLEGVRPDREGRYSIAVELIMTVYVERALRDTSWLLRPGGVPFLDIPPRLGWMPNRLGEQVSQVVADLHLRSRSVEASSFDFALEALRVMDLLFRASCVAPRTAAFAGARELTAVGHVADRVPSAFEICEEVAERAVVPILCAPNVGISFVSTFGSLHIRTASALLQPLLAASSVLESGTIGRRLTPRVLEWALPSDLVPPSPRVLLNFDAGAPSPLSILAAELAAAGLNDPIDGRRWSRFSFLVLWRVLSQTDNPAVVSPDLAPIFSARFEIEPLAMLVRLHPNSIPPRYFLRTFALEPLSDSLRSLADTVEIGNRSGQLSGLAEPHPRDGLALALISLRVRSGWPAMNSETRKAILEHAYTPLVHTVVEIGVSTLAPELVRTLAALAVSQILTEPFEVNALDAMKVVVRAAEKMDRKALVAELASWVRPQDVNVNWLVESAVLGADEAPEKKCATPAERFLCSLTESVDDKSVSLLDEVVDYLVSRNAYEGPADQDAVEAVYLKRVNGAGLRSSDKVLGQYRKFSKKWLDERGLGPGGLMSRLRRKP